MAISLPPPTGGTTESERLISSLVAVYWTASCCPVIRASNLRLSVSARNVFTISDYSGHDPEVSNFGNQNIARQIDVAPFPPSRSIWFSLDLGF